MKQRTPWAPRGLCHVLRVSHRRGSPSRRKQSTRCRRRGTNRRKKELFLNALWEVESKVFTGGNKGSVQKLVTDDGLARSRFRLARSQEETAGSRARLLPSNSFRRIYTLYWILDNSTYNCIRFLAMWTISPAAGRRNSPFLSRWLPECALDFTIGKAKRISVICTRVRVRRGIMYGGSKFILAKKAYKSHVKLSTFSR